MVDAGPSAAYLEALDLLEPVLSGAPLAHAAALAARAELQEGSARAQLLLEAAGLAAQAGDKGRAALYARASVAAEATRDSLLLLANLMRQTGEPAKAAAALGQAAQRSTAQERSGLLLEAAEAWEAAGDEAEARDVLLGLVQAQPEALPPQEWARRLLRVGAQEAAATYGYAPLLAQGAFAEALAVAEALGDKPRLREALWGLASASPESTVVRRLGGLVLEDGSAEERLRAARLAEVVRAKELASALHRAVVLAPPSAEDSRYEAGGPRVEALARLVANGEGDVVLAQVLEGLDADAPGALVDAVVAYARGRRGTERERALRLLASRLKERSGPLWQELFQRARDDNRLEEAAEALVGWVEATAEPEKRAALRTQLGDLHLQLGQTQSAEASYTLAASEDAQAPAPLQKLLSLVPAEEAPERFVSLAEQLQALAGPAAVAEVRPRLASAYARLGRVEEAYRTLGELPATPELLAQRAELADALGRRDESFALRQQLVHSPAERARLGVEALQAGLPERAVRLLAGAEAEVPPESRRSVAEQLATFPAGAPSAVALWPGLLSQGVLDADGYQAYALALRHTGRLLDATYFEEFARAARGELPLAELPPTITRLARPRAVLTHPLPPGALPVQAERMPQLHRALTQALFALGVPEVLAYLDPAGGPEAWLAGRETLVLGAGGLSLYGPAELAYLLALALLLGDEGVRLLTPGPLASVDRVAPAAFLAVRPLWRRRVSFSSSMEACAAQTWKAWTWPKSSKAAGPSTPSSSGRSRSCRVVERFPLGRACSHAALRQAFSRRQSRPRRRGGVHQQHPVPGPAGGKLQHRLARQQQLHPIFGPPRLLSGEWLAWALHGRRLPGRRHHRPGGVERRRRRGVHQLPVREPKRDGQWHLEWADGADAGGRRALLHPRQPALPGRGLHRPRDGNHPTHPLREFGRRLRRWNPGGPSSHGNWRRVADANQPRLRHPHRQRAAGPSQLLQ